MVEGGELVDMGKSEKRWRDGIRLMENIAMFERLEKNVAYGIRINSVPLTR